VKTGWGHVKAGQKKRRGRTKRDWEKTSRRVGGAYPDRREGSIDAFRT